MLVVVDSFKMNTTISREHLLLYPPYTHVTILALHTDTEITRELGQKRKPKGGLGQICKSQFVLLLLLARLIVSSPLKSI